MQLFETCSVVNAITRAVVMQNGINACIFVICLDNDNQLVILLATIVLHTVTWVFTCFVRMIVVLQCCNKLQYCFLVA
jgi:hypothetical protein